MNARDKVRSLILALVLGFPLRAYAQPVLVTAQLETNRLAVGASTVLHVFAQIGPEHQGGYAQIFSWSVDVITDGAAARLDSVHLLRPNSDNDPQTSSAGTLEGLNLRSVRDTFLNLTNAGRTAPVELFSVPVIAVEPGQATIAIQAGSGSDDPDFVIAPIGDGPTLTGGDYQNARVQLQVLAPLTNLFATIAQTTLPANQGLLITISFPKVDGYDYTVESSAALGVNAQWQALPNAPHNLGFADDTNSVPLRFYRIKAIPQ